MIYAVFSIVFIETKFQNNLDVLSSENLPTYNGNCPFSIEEGLTKTITWVEKQLSR